MADLTLLADGWLILMIPEPWLLFPPARNAWKGEGRAAHGVVRSQRTLLICGSMQMGPELPHTLAFGPNGGGGLRVRTFQCLDETPGDVLRGSLLGVTVQFG
jgi:hypothetical protein